MGQDILHRIAQQSFEFEEVAYSDTNRQEVQHLGSVELFSAATTVAKKIIGRHQDPLSKNRAGVLFKSFKNKNVKELEIRRFSLPINLGSDFIDDYDLFSRITISEKNIRSSREKQFHASEIGSIAIKLFNVDAQNQEKQLHLATCKKGNGYIDSKIDAVAYEPQRAMTHILYLLEETRKAIK